MTGNTVLGVQNKHMMGGPPQGQLSNRDVSSSDPAVRTEDQQDQQDQRMVNMPQQWYESLFPGMPQEQQQNQWQQQPWNLFNGGQVQNEEQQLNSFGQPFQGNKIKGVQKRTMLGGY